MTIVLGRVTGTSDYIQLACERDMLLQTPRKDLAMDMVYVVLGDKPVNTYRTTVPVGLSKTSRGKETFKEEQ